ncbi:aspartate/glutamate racemase family protein [Clostridioides difficile]|uniref:aspartate/glutamate racemase family protein n=1 Tax=Clostridioides difficile TaxID=1496 RepID=UPI00144269F0|nr:aspartate/glutamate racemase family protein [Clostridioides difficile]MCM0738136.1 aspartate/glutamate racemase family protein [Clostridioides difficile]MCM0742151.1 aspartate/glutamate racemase family protein [Clostridioides difficile]MCM0745939.1 aspartate/glutamate racemase family protein [Clostridioides difficile]MCP8367894.1 aspartate/glutamate racemase family protein [Clostridioides difficile]MCP8381132.1 aspartate/glutamate racemase family protein [Clostridioides difficile]
MKTIGLIGGMSWESTITYYQVINTVIKERLGGLHSSKCILYSVDFQEIEECQSSGNWEKSAKILADAAIKLQEAGADFIVICTNTMHKVSDKIQESIHIPLLHIADVTATVLREKEIKKVALLGTKYTMEQDFYKNVIINNGIEVLIPNEEDRIIVNDTICNELYLGIISESSKKAFLSIIDKLGKQGAEAVILGCTEIGLLIKQNDTSIPLFDTTVIHAIEAALSSI